VQRLLDARCQRGSCNAFENIFYSSRKFADNLFLVVHQSFLVIYPNFIFFRISCQILRKFAPWMPPSAASCPSKDIFLFFFGHLPTFSLGKLALWMPPRVDARGRRTVRTPLCTPLPRTKVFFPGYFPYTLSNRL